MRVDAGNDEARAVTRGENAVERRAEERAVTLLRQHEIRIRNVQLGKQARACTPFTTTNRLLAHLEKRIAQVRRGSRLHPDHGHRRASAGARAR